MRYISAFGAGILLFCSCHTTSFVPQMQNVPLFTGPKQFRYTPAFTFKSLDAGIAYSPVNRLGTMVNLQLTPNCFIPEIGLGTFYNKDVFVAEIYGGYAYINKIQNDDRGAWFGTTGLYSNIDIRANRWFLQPECGLVFNEHLELGFSMKGSYWDFRKYYYSVEKVIYTDTAAEIHGATQFTIEPAVTLRVGGDYVKFMCQMGAYAISTAGPHHPDPYLGFYSPLFMKLGLTVSFPAYEKRSAWREDGVRPQ